MQPETHSEVSLLDSHIKTNEDLVKFKEGNKPKFSRKATANPEDLPESTHQKILDAASKSFFGQATLLGLERSKTISKQTGRLFNTMLHKALQDKDFKVTFDLVQDKINHVTFSSSGSMDVAPYISRSMLMALGVLWSFAGATGLPFMRDLLDVIETAGGMVGKPVNTERELQIALTKALGDTLGTAATTILLDGPVNLNPVIDVKGRMGMGDLIPATAYFSPMTSEWQKSKELAGVGGAIGGLVDKAGSAMDYAQIGAYGQALGQLAPKAFTSLGQGTMAAVTGDYRNMQTGVKTNDATILDGFIKMLDAQPSGIAKEGRIRGLEMKDKAALQYVNKRAKEDYNKVLETGDQKQILEFRKAIDDYNATEPRYPITMNLKCAETNFAKSNKNWQEKRKTTKGLDWMDDYNPYLETEQ